MVTCLYDSIYRYIQLQLYSKVQSLFGVSCLAIYGWIYNFKYFSFVFIVTKNIL